MKGKNQIATVLFIILMVILFTGMTQMLFRLVTETPLRGAIEKVEKPKLSLTNWFSEDYQSAAEKYLNQEFGFRNWFVRLNNQLQFSLYHVAKARGVIVGKEDFLYEEAYIEAYYGRDFLGDSTIDAQLGMLKAVQDTLNTYGIDLVLAFAPGKASFYPQYIPDVYHGERSTTNHDYFVAKAKELDINHIDFSSWFLQIKDTARYCLYPKTGIHWSYYGMLLATDSLLHYIEDLRQTDLPDIVWDGIDNRKKLFGVDNDIEQSLNMFFPMPNFPMPYPVYHIEQDQKTKLKSLVIADSFYWQLQNSGFSKSLFDDGEFWFYNKQVYPARAKGGTWTKDLNLKEEILKRDVIILLCTEPVLKRLFWDFVSDSYQLFTGKQDTLPQSREVEIENIIRQIRNNKTWFSKVEAKAGQKNITVDSMLQIDAAYIYNKRRDKQD